MRIIKYNFSLLTLEMNFKMVFQNTLKVKLKNYQIDYVSGSKITRYQLIRLTMSII